MLSSQYLLKKIKEEEEEEGIKKLCIELHLYYLQPKFSITFSLWWLVHCLNYIYSS